MFPKPQLIPVSRLVRAENARTIDEALIATMLPTIAEQGGPFQPPGVVPDGDDYRIVWGNHRVEACRRAGIEEVHVVVLPPDTTAEREIEYSLRENHVRSDEDFEETLARIEGYAALKGCTIKEAAELAGVSPTLVSKWQSAARKLAPRVKELAKSNDVGVSVLYTLSRIPTAEDQLDLLEAFLARRIGRDDIAKAVRRSRSNGAKSITIRAESEGLVATLAATEEADYEQLFALLDEFKSRLRRHRRQDVPVRLLPDLVQ